MIEDIITCKKKNKYQMTCIYCWRYKYSCYLKENRLKNYTCS